MKKVLVLACVLVFALGSMANAAYIINANAKNSVGSAGMATAIFGEWPSSSTAQHAPTVSNAAQVSVIDDVAAPGQLLFRDLTSAPPETWTLLVHTGLDYTQDTVVFKLWTYSGTGWDSYNVEDACLTVVSDPMGRYTAGEILWQGAIGGEGSELAPQIQLELWANKTTNPFAEGILLTFGPCGGPVVPEPGSIVAMFTGLVGLAGYGLRKRS